MAFVSYGETVWVLLLEVTVWVLLFGSLKGATAEVLIFETPLLLNR